MLQRIGKYEVLETVAGGGQGAVYRARDGELTLLKVDDGFSSFHGVFTRPHEFCVFPRGENAEDTTYFPTSTRARRP